MIDNKTIRQVVINKALLPCTPGELEYHEAATAAGGHSVTFTTNTIGAIKDFVVKIVPFQSGIGDPSPDNVRPITGTDTLKFGYGPIGTIPVTIPDSYNIPLGQTVYGGEVDVDGGVMTKNLKISDLKDESWTYWNGIFYTSVSEKKNNTDILCNCLKFVGNFSSASSAASGLKDYEIGGYSNAESSNKYIYIKNPDFTNTTQFQTFLDNMQCLYELSIPTTAEITPVEINTFKGRQKMINTNKFAFSLKYPITVGGSCEITKQFLPIFYPCGKGVKHHGSTF